MSPGAAKCALNISEDAARACEHCREIAGELGGEAVETKEK